MSKQSCEARVRALEVAMAALVAELARIGAASGNRELEKLSWVLPKSTRRGAELAIRRLGSVPADSPHTAIETLSEFVASVIDPSGGS